MEKHILFYHVVDSGVHSSWDVKDLYLNEIFHTILTKHNVHFERLTQYTSFFRLVYHVIVIDGKWIHGACIYEEVCNVLILVEDKSERQKLGQ